jgi:hypothetical protein
VRRLRERAHEAEGERLSASAGEVPINPFNVNSSVARWFTEADDPRETSGGAASGSAPTAFPSNSNPAWTWWRGKWWKLTSALSSLHYDEAIFASGWGSAKARRYNREVLAFTHTTAREHHFIRMANVSFWGWGGAIAVVA